MAKGRGWLIAAGWVVAAVATTAAGVAAVDSLGAGLLGTGDDTTLSAEEVRRRLDAEPAAPSAPPAPATSRPAPATSSPVSRALGTPGGTVHVHCVNGLARMTAWSPASGYRADDEFQGPAVTVSITFKKGREEMLVNVTCVNGEPVVQVVPDDD